MSKSAQMLVHDKIHFFLIHTTPVKVKFDLLQATARGTNSVTKILL